MIGLQAFAANQLDRCATDAQPSAILVIEMLRNVDEQIFRIIVERPTKTAERPLILVSRKQKRERINAIANQIAEKLNHRLLSIRSLL